MVERRDDRCGHGRCRVAIVAFWALLAALISVGGPARAQDPVAGAGAPIERLREADGSLSPEAVRDLVARLSDEEVRALLLEHLDAVTPGEATEVGFNPALLMLDLHDEAQTVQERFVAMIAAMVDLPGVFADCGGARLGRSAALASALDRSRLRLDADRRLVGRTPVQRCDPRPAGERAGTRTTVMTHIAAIGVVRVVSLLSRFFLSPHAPALRLTYMADDQAAYLHRQNMILVCIAAFGFFTCSLVNLLGVVSPVHRLLNFLLGMAFVGTLIYTAWHGRAAIAGDIRGGETVGGARSAFADVWPGLIIAFVVVLYVTIVLINLAGGAFRT